MNQKSSKMNQKRLSVPLIPEVEELIEVLSEITNISKAQILQSLQTENIEHLKLKLIIAKYLQSKGYKVYMETYLGDIRPDIIGRKENRTIIAECLVSPFEKLCAEKVLKYSKYADDIYFAIPKEKFESNMFDGLGITVFLCDINNNKMKRMFQFNFDEELFNEKRNANKIIIVNCKIAPQVLSEVEKILKIGYYRNRTEIINEALRTFVRNYRRENLNNRGRRR